MVEKGIMAATDAAQGIVTQNKRETYFETLPMYEDGPLHKRSFFKIIVVVAILMVIGGIFFIVQKDSFVQIDDRNDISISDSAGQITRPDVEATQSGVAEIKRDLPWIEPSLDTESVKHTGDVISVTIRAFSGGKDVTGYDMLMGYDPEYIEIITSKSLLDQYQVYQYQNESHLALTGIKELESNNPFVFDSTAVAQIEVKMKKSGTTTISILRTSGKAKTQFVDAQVAVSKPQTGQVTFQIQ